MATEVARERKERRALRQDRTPPSPPDGTDSNVVADKRPASRERARGARRAHAQVAEHAVFLVPGLLGFDHFANFGYFADRVAAALRAGLEQTCEQPVPVIALPIPPTASLYHRQRMLVRSLADRLHALEHGQRPLQVHLVGHSTGGLDANLLTDDKPLRERESDPDQTWGDIDPRAPALRDRIRSVVSIASPHQGACITRDPLALFASCHDLRGLPALLAVSTKFVTTSLYDLELSDLAYGFGRDARTAARFLMDVALKWELLPDLRPTRRPCTERLAPDVVRRSFITVAGRATPGVSSNPRADALFRDFSDRASGWKTGCAEEGELVQRSVARLRTALASAAANELVIKAPGAELPSELDAGHNDGVVNSARQLMNPDDADELAGIVVGDHFDVAGHYDRRLWVLDRDGHEQSKQVLSGLLHSGSGFRDDQFFELYRRVADVIAGAIRR